MFRKLILLFLLNSVYVSAIEKDVWDYFKKGDYKRAKKEALTLSLNNTLYLIFADILNQFSYEPSFHSMVLNEIEYRGVNSKRMYNELIYKINTYLEKNSFSSDLALYLIAVYFKKNDDILNLRKKLLMKKQKVGLILPLVDFKNPKTKRVLINNRSFSYFRNFYILKKVAMKEYEEAYEVLKAQLRFPEIVRIIDYRNYITLFLGEHLAGGIGPSGPNGEPYYAPLYRITNWSVISDIHPVQKLMLAFSIGIGGGQNTEDAEKLLNQVDRKTLGDYNLTVSILKMYEAYHNYDYSTLFQYATRLRKGQKVRYYEFMTLYEFAYQLFSDYFRSGNKKTNRIAEIIYRFTSKILPSWSQAYKDYNSIELARTLYFNEKYDECIKCLKKMEGKTKIHVSYVFLSLAYYHLGRNEEGDKYKKEVKKLFEKTSIWKFYEEELKKMGKGFTN